MLSRAGALGISPATATALTQLSSATVLPSPSAPMAAAAASPAYSGIASLPDRLRATDFRSTSGSDLFLSFLTDATRNPPHKQKPFKSRDEFYEHILPLVRSTCAAGQLDNHRMLIEIMLQLMSKIESQLGWTAADAYWWRVQTEVKQGTHAFLSPNGSAMCAAVYASLFYEYGAGRHRSGGNNTAAAATTAATTPAKGKGKGTPGQCINHPATTSHTTATCRITLAAAAAEGKHA